jgi:hypothetical protein
VLEFADASQREAAGELLKRWQTMLRGRAQLKGWKLDYTHDLARVLRVPGSLNYKDPTNPVMVAMRPGSRRRYDISELVEILEETEYAYRELGLPSMPEAAQALHAAASGGPAQYEDRTYASHAELQFRVQSSATVDDDLIEQLCAIDPRFRATWEMDRPDIQGQGEQFSEYDMALANFGVRAQLPIQVIANLMIQFRRRHGGKAKPRLDYYQRTIFEAMRSPSRREAPAPIVIPAALPTDTDSRPATSSDVFSPASTQGTGNALVDDAGAPASSPQPAPTAPADPDALAPGVLRSGIDFRSRTDADRIAMLTSASTWLGLRILRLVKVTGREPSYMLELEIGRIELSSTQKLIDQGAFRSAIAASLNILPDRMQRDDWERFVRLLMGSAVEVDGGAENETEGDTVQYLQQYLVGRSFITDTRNMAPGQYRNPVVIDGRIAVNAVDVQAYLWREFNRRSTTREIAAGLASIGAEAHRWRLRGMDQSRWLLPVNIFRPEEYQDAEQRIA